MKEMNQRLAKLLDAHVQHELTQFQGARLRKAVGEEVAAAFEWTRRVRLKDLVTAEQVMGVIHRNVVELPIAGGVAELAGEMSRRVLASRHNKRATLEDIFTRKQFDDFVEKAASLESLRKRLIHRAVHTPAYTGLISDVVYSLIRDFILKESHLANRMPGVSSLLRMGKEAVNKAMPNLEVAVECGIKDFIQASLEKALQLSEQFLIDFLDEDRILKLTDMLWDAVAGVPLADHFSSIDADDLEDFLVMGIEFWMHFRKTRYFDRISTELVRHFFEKYGDREVDVILEDVEVTPEMVIHEAMEILSPAVEKALTTGYLEQRIRARLAGFYGSKKAAALV